VTAIASETAAASHERTANEEAHPPTAATGRAAHDESAVAGAATTTATGHGHLSDAMIAIEMAHVNPEDEAEEAIAIATTTATTGGATHHGVPEAAHLHPAGLEDPTSHRAAGPSNPRLRHAKSSRKRSRRMWR
tara:strand:- start:42130 stop:42531 length:402 start_codon:yes stop_codon:yes gene_type:complete